MAPHPKPLRLVIGDLDPEVIDIARRAMNANSWRALRSDIRIFSDWCQDTDELIFPAEPSVVAWFLREQAECGKKVATLSRYASSIARIHRLADAPDPTKTERVRLELKAQRRELGVRQKQARGLRFRGEVADPLSADASMGVSVEVMMAAADEGLRGRRNSALLSTAFDTGLRRSELVAITWGDIEQSSAGSGRLFVARSKSDQEGAGAYAYLSPRTMSALLEWRELAELTDGAVFRRLHRSRTKMAQNIWTVGARLTGQSVTLIYRSMLDTARGAGLLETMNDVQFEDWRRALTAQSTRNGLAQDLFAAGEDLAGSMQALRWKSPAQPARYAQTLCVEGNAAAKVVDEAPLSVIAGGARKNRASENKTYP